MLQEAIFLGIQRFPDPASARGHRTASLEQVRHSIPHTAGNVTLRRTLRKNLTAIQKACADINEWRDRQIAHLDYQTVFQQHPTTLNSVQIRTAKTAIEGIVNFLRQVAEHCYSRHHSFAFRGEPLDAGTLMFFVEQGLKQRPPLRYSAKHRSTDS